MLVGIALGILITLLVLAVLFLVGKCRAYEGLVAVSQKELYDAQLSLGRFVHLEQERQRIKEGVIVNVSEEHITALANRVCARVQTILESQTEAALKKMN